jgi:predicted ester cyclase
MRRPLLPLALVLAVATGLVLAELGLAVIPPPVPDGTAGSAAANAAAVHRFYDAVNRALRTGDTAPLDALLAPDFVEHAAYPGQTGDRDGLARYLRVLRRAAPALAVTGDDLVAQGDRVAARVRLDEAGSESVTSLPPVTGRAWGTLDLFRLRAGRIAEHWGDDLGLAVAEPLLQVGVDVVPPAEKWGEVGRLSFPPGGVDRQWTSGPTVLFVEAGSLAVAYDPVSAGAASLVPAAAARRAVAPGEAVALGEGDALGLASGSFFEARNGGTSPATVLVLWSGDPAFPHHVGTAQVAPDTAPGTPAPAATYATLAGGIGALFPEGRATVAIGRIALAPGAAVAGHRVASAEFVVVEAGRLALSVEGGQARLRTGPDDATRAASGGTAATGAGLAFDAGATVGIAPAGDQPLVALVIAVGPEREGSQPAS